MADAKLLEGRKLAEKLLQAIEKEIKRLTASSAEKRDDTAPTMVALSVGNNQASEVYLKSQKKIAEKVGIRHLTKSFKETMKEDALIQEIEQLNNDPSIHGIIVQMPLPQQIRIGRILDVISPEKDIEGVHPYNLGRLVLKKNIFVPCTAHAVMELIDATGADLYGAEVVIVGAGKVVGRPLALLLMERMATTTVCNIGTSEKKRLETHVRGADVLIVAAGKANLIPGEWIKEGSIVVDVGINHCGGKVVGDVDFEGARKKAAYITPVPGGVGPLTVTILMRNVLTAYQLLKGFHE
ncbi:MAG: bifunctional 5,10-methylenetetrahydrofolate dehydrogenase/5,10-methenyltetrahydrofolate cyclohydrolase [Candidatus Omnitrophica bacterium]|nr:bifunctional 5,10-methylenetetrahydrofolate dehydrogenase/5,10-methenyltetrahydrofolate cyclohydrolase [Candidatus Omnitrophota bacterium]